MTTITLRRMKDDFVVTGPDIEPANFKTRREAKDWCVAHYPGSPIKEIGADESERRTRAMPRKGPCCADEDLARCPPGRTRLSEDVVASGMEARAAAR
jgi:hypothetical protein